MTVNNALICLAFLNRTLRRISTSASTGRIRAFPSPRYRASSVSWWARNTWRTSGCRTRSSPTRSPATCTWPPRPTSSCGFPIWAKSIAASGIVYIYNQMAAATSLRNIQATSNQRQRKGWENDDVSRSHWPLYIFKYRVSWEFYWRTYTRSSEQVSQQQTFNPAASSVRYI